MKDTLLALVLFALACMVAFTTTGQLQVSDKATPAAVDEHAILHLDSDDKGLLPPKVALVALNNPAPLSTGSLAAGMLVFNTGTNVSQGYYYWDGSNWVRLGGATTGEVALNPVLVTTSGTLDIENNMVLLTAGAPDYRLNLVLPDITSTDNGRTITLKHIGDYKDIMLVLPNTGELLDDFGFYALFRHESATFMAWEGTWVAIDKLAESKRVFTVSNFGSWKTLHEVLECMEMHQDLIVSDFDPVIILSPGTYKIESTIEIDFTRSLTIEGVSYGKVVLIPGDELDGPMFNAKTEAYFKMLYFDARGNPNNEFYSNTPGHTAIHISDFPDPPLDDLDYYENVSSYFEVKDFYIYGFYDGIIVGANAEVWIFEGDIEGSTLRGMCTDVPALAKEGYLAVKVSEVDFIGNKVGFCLSSGQGANVSLMNCGFYPGEEENFALGRIPENFNSIRSVFISNNTWDNTGAFFAPGSFDFSLERDANIQIVGNAGVPDNNPSAFVNILTPTIQSLAEIGTWYYLFYTPSDTILTKFSYDDLDIIYLSEYSKDVNLSISGTIEYSGNAVFELGIWRNRNGVFTGPFSISRARFSNQASFGYFTVFGKIQGAQKDDFFIVAVRRVSGGAGNFTLHDLQVFLEVH